MNTFLSQNPSATAYNFDGLTSNCSSVDFYGYLTNPGICSIMTHDAI